MGMKIVRESISFQRGQEPLKATGLGIEQQIKQWYREAYDHEPNDNELIYDILNDSELEDDAKEQWALFLVSKGYNWDYEEWSEMLNRKINFIPAIPDGQTRTLNSLRFVKKQGKNYIEFNGWEDWADHIEEGRDISKESIEAILSGDAFEYFDSDYHPDVSDSSDFILGIEEAVKMIQEKFIEMGGDSEVSENPEEMLDVICEDDAFEELEDAISYAISSAQSLADEDEAYQKIKKALIDHFEIDAPQWNGDMYVAEISDAGLSKLLDSKFDSNNRLSYTPPYYGYQGDVTNDMFIQELDSKLANF
jgi:hypothetical protein